MQRVIYPINKGINASIIFRGLKGQYIWYMGAAIFALMILYAVMYMIGINTYVSLLITLTLAGLSTALVYHLSAAYGEHGLTKALARRSIPHVVKATSRVKFMDLKKAYYAEATQ
jgi:membrane protein implicated in regulation of membrane protease activity